MENNKNKKSVKFQGNMLNIVILFKFLYLSQITTLKREAKLFIVIGLDYRITFILLPIRL